VKISSGTNDHSLVGHHDVSVVVWFIGSVECCYRHPLAVDRLEGPSFRNFKVYTEVRGWRKRERDVSSRWGGSRRSSLLRFQVGPLYEVYDRFVKSRTRLARHASQDQRFDKDET
jgi:hypothetical protein